MATPTPSTAELHAALRLRESRRACKRVYSVESAGDSGTGCETVLYVTPQGGVREAFFEPKPRGKHVGAIFVRSGW